MTGHHPLHIYKFKYSELNEMYLAETIKNVAFSLVSVFIPIYLLKLGYSFSAVALFYMSVNIIRFFIEPCVGYLISRFGPKHILSFSYPFSFVYLLMIAALDSYHFHLFYIAIFFAIADSMHWVAFHSNFSKVKKSKRSGRELGFMQILAVIASALGPLAGGFIGKEYGLRALFYVAPVLLVGASAPLLKTSEKVKKRDLSYKGLLKRMKYDILANTGANFDNIAGATLWPLLIFLLLSDYLKIGFIVSAAFFISIISVYLIGRLSDVINRRALLLFGTGTLSVVNFMRYSVSSANAIFRVNLLGTIFGPLLLIPLYAIFYSHAEEQRRIEYTVLLEMAGDFSRACIWVVILIMSYTMPMKQVLATGFLIASVGVLITNIIKHKLVKPA